ncbi:MAG TPA: RNA polymerase sigma factor [Acidimicrobiales bacterium]|nr:RNA polymerase sigma factor [Acidimicrobiales bacterium]
MTVRGGLASRPVPPAPPGAHPGKGGTGLAPEPVTDETLLAGLGGGGDEVAVAFVRRFQAHVYAIALAIVGDRALAEDVAQQAFERVWRRASTFDAHRGDVRTWLATITRNLAVDAVRVRRPLPLDPGDLVRLLGSDGDGPEPASVRNCSRDHLRAAIRRLPPGQARALVMAGIFGMTAREVAGAEGVALGTAKTRIRTAMLKLRADLAPVEVIRD